MASWRTGESAVCGYIIVFLMMSLSHGSIIIKTPSCVLLYLPEASKDFKSVSSEIVETIRIGDQRFGVRTKGTEAEANIMRFIHYTFRQIAIT